MKQHHFDRPIAGSRVVSACLGVVLSALCTSMAQGQSATCIFRGAPDALAERPSPLDSVEIRLGDASAKLCYGRPVSGGRTVVGGQDPFGSPWRLGANEPTTLHLPFAAAFGGVELGPGSYSLYAIPEAGRWTIVINGSTNRWGIPITPEVRRSDIGSLVVQTAPLGAPVERLTFRFDREGDSAGVLVYSWEQTTFGIPISRR